MGILYDNINIEMDPDTRKDNENYEKIKTDTPSYE